MPYSCACSCGQTRWTIKTDTPGRLIVCYCKDCRSAAEQLGAAALLDEAGGSTLYQALPSDIAFTDGAENLSVMQLRPDGLLRWYAGCCGTPIANTLRKPGLPFAGYVLPAGTTGFGEIRARVMTKSATAPTPEHGFAGTGFGILSRALRAKLRGNTSGAPFFQDGIPTVQPKVLSENQSA